MITQRDSKVLKSDSKAMKTVAILTMVFLPATFTSASNTYPPYILPSNIFKSIFGMNFFDFSPHDGNQPESWDTSGKIWIFWLVAAVLTAMTTVVWVLWQYPQVVKKYTNCEFWKRFWKELRNTQGHNDVEKDH
jgi:hypothetical protein